jgi:hypothetical protein
VDTAVYDTDNDNVGADYQKLSSFALAQDLCAAVREILRYPHDKSGGYRMTSDTRSGWQILQWPEGNMNYLEVILPLFNTILFIGFGVGGIMAYRNGKTRTANEVQDRVINAMQHELDLQTKRIDEVVKENTRLEHVILLIKKALMQRGLSVTIDGELVILHSADGSMTQATRIVENGIGS